MKLKTWFALIIFITLIGLSFISISTLTKSPPFLNLNSPSSLQNGNITVIDDTGMELRFNRPVEKIVFLSENAMQTMYALDQSQSIVGVGGIELPTLSIPFYEAIDPRWNEKTKLSAGNNLISLEVLAQADPELVVLWSSDWGSDLIATITSNFNIPVYSVYITGVGDVDRQVQNFAKLTGNEKRGEEILAQIHNYSSRITDRTILLPDTERPSVLWIWEDMYGSAGVHSSAHDLIYMAGGKNALNTSWFVGKELEHPVLSLETIARIDPDIIYMWYSDRYNPEDIISGKDEFEGWKDLKAVKTHRVYEIPDPFVYDFDSPRYPLTLIHMAQDIHPELFGNISMDYEVDQYYSHMYRVHYPGYASSGV